jgi:site-specific DNA recombinase
MTNLEPTIIYPRKSREDEQREKETGEDCLAVMTELLENTVKRLGISSFVINPEIGSADTIDGRPVFSEILNDMLPSGKWKSITVREISRLGRGNFTDAGRIYHTITKHKIYIITPQRIYDPTNKADLRFLRMELFMAREEYEMTKDRLWYGKDERAKQGFAGGYLPVLGLTSVRGRFILIPEEIETLTRIFEMRAAEVSFTEIATTLNNEGVLSKKGRKWDPTSIRQITFNNRYIGIAKWDGQEFPAKHPPLVDIELWNRVQEVNKRRAIPTNRVDNEFIVKLYCHECGNRMYGWNDRAKEKVKGEWKYYNFKPKYHCFGRKKPVRCYHTVRAEQIHEFILEELTKLVEKDMWDGLVKAHNKKGNMTGLKKVYAEKVKLLKAKKDFLVKLDYDYSKGELAPSLYSKHYDQTERQINSLELETAELKQKINRQPANVNPNEIRKRIKHMLKVWDTLPNLPKKKLIAKVFPRIEISKTGEWFITRQLPSDW